jgi:pimeloyl-ACP methyl ester carboxylesterase
MIHEPAGSIAYDESGDGPTVVFVPGSCSTGAAWRPVTAALKDRFRCVTTSLLGYGATAERRTRDDTSVSHEADIIEAVMQRAGGRVHLVGHSFGGLVSLVVAIRAKVPPASLVIAEAAATELLRASGEHLHHRAFRTMTDGYFAAFEQGDEEAIVNMIDFYGGVGTLASWPTRVRAYALETTAVNIRDWANTYGFPLSQPALEAANVLTLVLRGGSSHAAMQRANEILSTHIAGAMLATIPGAAHFMISTHAEQVARAIAGHVERAERH